MSFDPRREVIDGQQRLTTLQLVLKAAEHALADLATTTVEGDPAQNAIGFAIGQLEPLTRNPATADEEERYKVWPTNEDRGQFRDVMDASPEAGPALRHTLMAEAYRYFRGEFKAWLTLDRPGDRSMALASALKDHLRLIVLDLDDSDEPQAIFETLNAHGTPLLPADLIKNWLLWEGTRQSLPIAELYIDHWRHFDRDSQYWRAKVGTGHAARARVDTFLLNWLTRHVREPVSAKHLYDRFLRFVENGGERREGGGVSVTWLMQDIMADAQRYKVIDAPPGTSRFDVFLHRLRVLDVIVFHPLLLAVMGREGSTLSDLNLIGVTLESYLVRRMVCNMQTRGYGTLALNLLDRVAALPQDAPAAPAIISALTASTSGADRWPSDDEFRSDWLNKKFYNSLRRSRVLMILRAIEELYQSENSKSEPVLTFNFNKLEIEHILPQAWEQNWPLSDPTISHDNRNYLLHGIGNLTLVSSALNKSLSHAPWSGPLGSPSKQAGLSQHTKLELNARLLKDHALAWDEIAIRDRATSLFAAAIRIWPAATELSPRAEPDLQPAAK